MSNSCTFQTNCKCETGLRDSLPRPKSKGISRITITKLTADILINLFYNNVDPRHD